MLSHCRIYQISSTKIYDFTKVATFLEPIGHCMVCTLTCYIFISHKDGSFPSFIYFLVSFYFSSK